MYILVSILVTIFVLGFLAFFYSLHKQKIEFYITGLDSKFNLSDLHLLWTVAQLCDLDNPTALFFSLQALTKCMAQINNQAAKDGSEKDPKKQALITKLFNYRTKLQNDNDEKKGLESTQYLDKNQRLRIILPGKGVFASKILNNGKEMIIAVPRQKEMIPITAEEWVGKTISVYLWRKGDARYVFDTIVTGHGLFIGESSISLRHSTNLVRTQKRRSVRAKCDIQGQLFIIKEEIIDYSAIETKNGYKCQIEDISESGAQIRIGGKGVANIQIKIQFNIRNMLIIMFGVVRTVEYNEELNQSLLHFECIHIEPMMKNEVLSYVYNMLPEREKEVYEALNMIDADEKVSSSEEEVSESSDSTSTVQMDESNPVDADLNVIKPSGEEVSLPDMPDTPTASNSSDDIDDSLNIFQNYDL